jgi:hypothetical protein
MTDPNDDPTAWLGDPVGMHISGRSTVVVSVPPGDRRALVISLVDAPTIEDAKQTATSYVRVNLDGARGLQDTLAAAISQLEEHADS